MRWEIEKLHRDVKALGLEDSSFWTVDSKITSLKINL